MEPVDKKKRRFLYVINPVKRWSKYPKFQTADWLNGLKISASKKYIQGVVRKLHHFQQSLNRHLTKREENKKVPILSRIATRCAPYTGSLWRVNWNHCTTCQSPWFCPWCRARRFAPVFEGIISRYGERDGFHSDHSFGVFGANLKIDNETVSRFGGCLWALSNALSKNIAKVITEPLEIHRVFQSVSSCVGGVVEVMPRYFPKVGLFGLRVSVAHVIHRTDGAFIPPRQAHYRVVDRVSRVIESLFQMTKPLPAHRQLEEFHWTCDRYSVLHGLYEAFRHDWDGIVNADMELVTRIVSTRSHRYRLVRTVGECRPWKLKAALKREQPEYYI